MGYLLETAPLADLDLDALNPHIRAIIIKQLIEFAKSPGSVKTTSARPPYPVGQLLQFTFGFEVEKFWAGVVFHYSQDESSLIVYRVFVEML